LSTNNGGNWTAINNGLSCLNVKSLAVNGSNIFAGTLGGGIFQSNDNGSNWTSVNTGLTNYFVNALAISGVNIYAGIDSNGVWKRPLSEVLGISKFITDYEIKIFPNPIKDYLTIETSSNSKQYYEIINLVGVCVFSSYLNKISTIDVSFLLNGIYFLKISSEKGNIVKKFIKT
jgi:hypothetical protein